MLGHSDYATIISLETNEDVVSYLLNNSDYKNSLSQYYTRYNPILSFIKSLHMQNSMRWNNLTRNVEYAYQINIGKIQQNIDLKNVLLVLNLLPDLQNDQNINLESLFTNLSFGGSISYHNWMELSNNLSLNNFLGKTVFLAPRIHEFLIKIKNKSNEIQKNFLTLETISNITFKENPEELFKVTSELLAFDVNVNILRFLLRFENDLRNDSAFLKFKSILSPWKNVKSFLGNEVFKYDQFDELIIKSFLEKIYQLNINYNLNLSKLPSSDMEKLTKDDLNKYEALLSRSKFTHLKRKSIAENLLAKVLLVLVQIIQEIENLSWIVFGKSQGFDNEVISEGVFIL